MAQKKKPKSKCKTSPQDLKLFLDLHFAKQNKYEGFFPITMKKGRAMVNCGFFQIGEVYEGIRDFKFFKTLGYYISSNSFCKMNRKRDNLFSFNNIVIDIDSHNGRPISKSDLDLFMDCLPDYIDKLDQWAALPHPNTVVFTGRGFQLWWAIEQLSASAAWIYDHICKFFMESMQKVLLLMAPYLKVHVHLDRSPSSNKSGMFRLPGTYNPDAGVYGHYKIYHETRYDILPLYRYLKDIEEGERKTETLNPAIRAASYGEKNALKYADKLLRLIEMRQKSGSSTVGNELRDLFLFCTHCILAQTLPLEKVHLYLAKMNNTFLKPLPEQEWKAYMSGCDRQKYKITCAKIIELLGITPEEQKAIGLYPKSKAAAQKKKARAERKAQKENRNFIIEKLLCEELSAKKIAKEAGCSEATVSRYLKQHGLKTVSKTNKEKALQAIKKGASPKEAAKKYGVHKSTIYSALAAKKEREEKQAKKAQTKKIRVNKKTGQKALSQKCEKSKNRKGQKKSNAFTIQAPMAIRKRHIKSWSILQGAKRSAGGWTGIPVRKISLLLNIRRDCSPAAAPRLAISSPSRDGPPFL